MKQFRLQKSFKLDIFRVNHYQTTMAREKGYYSKVSRHARKSEACAKCQAQADKILQRNPRRRKARAPRTARKSPKRSRKGKKTLFDEAGDVIIPPKRAYRRRPKASAADIQSPW